MSTVLRLGVASQRTVLPHAGNDGRKRWADVPISNKAIVLGCQIRQMCD